MASVLYLDTLQTMQTADALRALAEAEAVSGFYQGEGSYLAVARKLMAAASVELEGEIASRCKGWAAVTAERERILALIREWPNRPRNWALNPYMSPRELGEAMFYAVKDEQAVCEALAALIEATDG